MVLTQVKGPASSLKMENIWVLHSEVQFTLIIHQLQSLFLSSWSFHLFIFISIEAIHPSIYLYIYLSINIYFNLSIYLLIYHLMLKICQQRDCTLQWAFGPRATFWPSTLAAMPSHSAKICLSYKSKSDTVTCYRYINWTTIQQGSCYQIDGFNGFDGTHQIRWTLQFDN